MMMTNPRRNRLVIALVAVVVPCLTALPETAGAARSAKRMNVLFIAVDDLRPQLGCYGNKLVKSPHIDRLASEGTVFLRAYCQQAVCSPSRTSLLTGRRPDTTKVYDLTTHFRKHLPDVVTLPQHFKKHGYHTQSFGKIYHGGLDDPQSWSVKSWFPSKPNYGKPKNIELMRRNKNEARKKNRKLKGGYVVEKDPKTGTRLKINPRRVRPKRGPSWEDPDVGDADLRDGETAEAVIRTLRKLKNQDKPFFLAAGFYKPHLPFVAPKRYFDLYKDVDLPPAPNPFAPRGAPPYALTNFGELRNYSDIPTKGPVSEAKARELVLAYHACVSYTDAQVGKLLDELDRLGLTDNTVVVLWGDHGWQLGEHGIWCKHTNFETSTHAPLIIRVPGQKTAGAKSSALVEFVDIYPSLCEACELPLPDGLEGLSFKPLLDEPGKPWKKAALSQYPRGAAGVGRIMGYSARTDRWRCTLWLPRPGARKQDWRFVELYDHRNDPMENVNVAGKPENATVVKELTKLIEDGWRAALPR